MDYTTKLAYQSNYWYNDGLNKANIRDLTGAITSLKKSLQYNRDNIASRNLLGLVYYGRGDVVEALAEWVLSKNLQPKENIANYYIQKVKEKRDDLDRINQAIKDIIRLWITVIRDVKIWRLCSLRKQSRCIRRM